MANYYLGLDLGGTFIKAGVVDGAGKLLAQVAKATAPDGDLSAEAVIGRVVEAGQAAAGLAKIKPRQIAAVGVVAPGQASYVKGIVHRAANFPGWKNVPLRERLARSLHAPVVLENDANAAAYAEYWVGTGKRKPESLLVITLGTGVGGGFLHEGRLVRGLSELAGEIGHTIVELNGYPCKCGRHGCLETYCSAHHTARRAAAALRKSPVRSSLVPLLEARGRLSAEDVVAHAAVGDAFAMEQWDITCRYIALGCLNAMRVLDPDEIVLAGGLAKAKDRLLTPVSEHLQKMWWKISPLKTKLRVSKLSETAGMIGAAGLARVAGESGAKSS